jgi:hypothetical protein
MGSLLNSSIFLLAFSCNVADATSVRKQNSGKPSGSLAFLLFYSICKKKKKKVEKWSCNISLKDDFDHFSFKDGNCVTCLLTKFPKRIFC